MLLEFSAVTEAEKVIQEMQERIKLCKEVKDKTVAHIELSRELNESLRNNGLQPLGWRNLRTTLTEIWELGNAPIDDSGVISKLEDAQSELSILDKEHEQLKVEKQNLESKLSMTVQSNKELLLEKQKLESKIKELENLTDSLDNSEQELNSYSENLQIEINDLKSAVEKLTAENKDLKNQKLNWVVGKERNALGAKPPKPRVFQRVAELESLVAELQSANQSLEWQKDKALAMVKTQTEQEIPQASEWKVNDIVQILDSGKKVRIIGHCSDKKLGHFVCLMPDGNEENFFTGQLRFISGDAEDIPQVDSQLTLDLTTESCPIEPGALVEINCTKKGEDKTWNGLPGYVQEIKGKKAKIALQGDYREKWFSLSALKVLELPPQGLKTEEVGEQIVPPQLRAEHFKTGFNKKTNWEDFRLFAEQDPEVVREIFSFSSKTGKKVKQALPKLFADYILRTGDRSDFEWIDSTRFENLVEEVIVDEQYVPPQERAHQFIKSYKVKTTWENFQEVAQGDSDILKEISMSNLKKKLTVKTALPGLFGDYVLRTGNTSDLAWLNSPTFDKVASEAMSKRSEQELEQSLQQTASEFFSIYNSPKKLGNIKWETIRDYAQGKPEKIDALIKCASASSGNKENSKTQFCDNLENLCVDYIARTGDKSDLDWVPFAKLVSTKLEESNAVSREENLPQETALSKVNSASILQAEEVDPATEVVSIESKISSCKTVDQLEEISSCNPSNIQDADDAGVIVDIYEIHVERTGEFEKLNWLPESIQDEIYQRLGRGSQPLDFEIGEKVRGTDPYSVYCSKTGIITRLTPGLISVAWEDGKFNTHYAEDLEIIPESLALQVA